MDDDEQPPLWPSPPPRPPRAPLRDRARERLAEWDVRLRSTGFVPEAETVMVDLRRHVVLLLAPVLRTLAGLVALAAGMRFESVVAFGLLTAFWAAGRLSSGLRRTATTAAGATLGLVALDGLWGPLPVVVLLLLWLAEDVADWLCDRLVVTDKRIYRRYGVVTGHSPSISLMAVGYLDAAVPPIGRLLHYGTLRLDSAMQDDGPLSRFDLVPDVVAVAHEILRLRTKAMPKYPQN